MIITRTPFRVSFAGGGSDLPEYFRKAEGAVLSSAIDKYIYIAAHPFFEKGAIHLKYSQNELVRAAGDIHHPIFRSVLDGMGIAGVEITSIADIPAGTGLGSSSSFTVGLHLLAHAYQDRFISKADLARLACETEIEKLREPVGKQDQYAAAYGGLNLIRFLPTDDVIVEPVLISQERRRQFEGNLLMFYTGDTRSAKSVLTEQKANTATSARSFAALESMAKQAFEIKKCLESDSLDDVGRILNEGWVLKRTLAAGVTSEKIDHYYRLGIEQGGALGGKLLGAGGGGFLLFYVPPANHERIRQVLKELREVPFAFDIRGAEIIFYDNQRF